MERRLKESLQTSEAIRRAMVGLLNVKDYHTITVSEIAEHAGIRRTTFYLFYSSKSDLVSDICATFLHGYLRLLRLALSMEDKAEDELYREAFSHLSDNAAMLEALWQLELPGFDPYRLMQRSVEEEVRSALAAGGWRMKNGVPAELFAQLYAADVMATVRWWISHGSPSEIPAMKWMIETASSSGLFALLEKEKPSGIQPRS